MEVEKGKGVWLFSGRTGQTDMETLDKQRKRIILGIDLTSFVLVKTLKVL